MKYGYMVKYNGEYYSAGTEVPVEAETKSKTSKSKVEKQ